MKLHYLVIGIIFTSLIILGSLNFLSDIQNNYSASIDTSYINDTSQRLNDYNKDISQLSNTVTNFSLEINSVGDVFDIPYKFFQVGKSITDSMFSGFSVLTAIVSDTYTGLNEQLGIPSWLFDSIIAILGITLVAMLLYSFIKWKIED